MRKVKAIALAAPRPDAISMTIESLSNSAVALIDFMYGTPERTRATYGFALLLLGIAAVISAQSAQAMAVCPV